MKFLLALFLSLIGLQAATLSGGVLYSTDTTGTNARPSRITITPSTGGTNLWVGTLNATNDITLNGVSITNSLGIWTNDNGTISATSTAPDGTLSYLMDSQAQAGGLLMQIKNAGNQRFNFYSQGNVDLYGDAPGLYITTDDNTFVAMNDRNFEIYVNSTRLMYLTPDANDGDEAYEFGTSKTHTSGNLLEVANNGTNKLALTALGQIVLAGTTNQVTFGATNDPPVSSLVPTKWISVQVAGESATYRIPLYE